VHEAEENDMPQFGSPFSELANGRKLTDEELVRANQFMVAAEYEATQMYVQLQAALNLVTRKEADCLVNVFVSCLEDTLVEHLAEDGYYLKLNGFGKFIVHHRPPIRRKIGLVGKPATCP
jgi:nucleoid DNA-binding protein